MHTCIRTLTSLAVRKQLIAAIIVTVAHTTEKKTAAPITNGVEPTIRMRSAVFPSDIGLVYRPALTYGVSLAANRKGGDA